jgi:hypothetical protein
LDRTRNKKPADFFANVAGPDPPYCMLITDPDPEPGIGKCEALERSENKTKKDLTKAKTKIRRKKFSGKRQKKNRSESNCPLSTATVFKRGNMV